MEPDGRQLKLLQNRDPDAWRDIYQELGGDLFGYAYHLLRGNHALAEEMAQAAWLTAIEVFHQFDPSRGTLRNWLIAIVRQRVLLYYRRQVSGPEAMIGSESLDVNWPSETSSLATPPEVMEDLERRDIVRAALLCLPRDRREVLLGKYVDGHSVAKLAESTGRTEKAVESLLSRAKAQLRELLAHYFEIPRSR